MVCVACQRSRSRTPHPISIALLLSIHSSFVLEGHISRASAFFPVPPREESALGGWADRIGWLYLFSPSHSVTLLSYSEASLYLLNVNTKTLSFVVNLGHTRCCWLFLLSRTVKKIFNWNLVLHKMQLPAFWEKHIQARQNEYTCLLAIYWGHMKQNNWSVQETEHYYL